MIEKINDEQHKEVDRVLNKLGDVLEGEKIQVGIVALSSALAMIAFHKAKICELGSIIELIKAQYKVVSDKAIEGQHL